MLYEVSKLYEFEAAHQLESSCASAECERVHGHSYKLVVGMQTDRLDNEEMVLNFNHLDKVVKPVIDEMDHRVLVPLFNTGQSQYYDKVPGMEVYTLQGSLRNTTAERLAEFFVKLVYLNFKHIPGLKKIWATVNETRKCQARAEMVVDNGLGF